MTRFIAIIAALLNAGVALAHAKKEATTPADGAIVIAPEAIHMVFDSLMRVTLVRLLDADGVEMALDRETGMEPTLEFRAFPAALAPGAYRVEWRGLAADGHPMDGAFAFTVK